MMQSKGFSVWYPFFMSMFIFAALQERLHLSFVHPLPLFIVKQAIRYASMADCVEIFSILLVDYLFTVLFN